MSDDTRAPRQPSDDGHEPEAGGGAGEPRELPDPQDRLEAALARSRGIGEDGEVPSGEVLAGDDLAFDGRAEAPTDPALAPQEDVRVAFADPLATDGTDPNATVGLDRDELAAVLADGPRPGAPAGAAADTEQTTEVDGESASTSDTVPSAPEAGADGHAGPEDASASEDVPVMEREIAEGDDAADFRVTEPVPAQDLAADALGAASVSAITVDAAGSATAPDEERESPRRTLEIDRTAARVAASSAARPSAQAAVDPEPSDDHQALDGATPVAGEVTRADVVVTETVTEQLAEDGETVEAVTVTERVEVLDEADAAAVTHVPTEDAADADADADADAVLETDAADRPEAAPTVESTHATDERVDTDSARPDADASATQGDDDSTFAPLRLSAPTDSDDLAPVKPKKRGNRMFAVFVALVASVVFAALYLLAFALLRTAFNTGLDPIGEASEFAITAAFTVPVTVFAAFGVLWALIVNRAGWWAYVLGGFLAAVLVAAGYYFGAALQQHLADGLPITSIQLDEVLAKFRASEHLLSALVAAIAAREAFTWVGGIAAARGRRVSRANRRAKLGYEKRMAERSAETADANGVAE
ncbi:hypothetical protein HDC34_001177 [Pseudoclavibacter sp. JAI123]|uniref:hypothetical protein n=1 Tax=Pseudoclavibacter sp. JAI123 TaxID=2723065 RepID=UPI0015C8B784|nr:hypothetical protein [Pseudoclavibacter sp. JAI123]NYF12883.1 hypothetical protein [Pseudoclavibacter sp. JAI123]